MKKSDIFASPVRMGIYQIGMYNKNICKSPFFLHTQNNYKVEIHAMKVFFFKF